MSGSPRIVLGIDGGGTKTVARVVAASSDGKQEVLGSGFGGGSNPYSVGWEAAEEAITRAVTTALSQAGEGPTPEAAVVAIAGCATAASRQRLADWAGQQDWAAQVEVVPDTAPILADAPDGLPAIGLIAGTGSSALAKRRDGEVRLVGGWGYLIDDGGSGYALGRAALLHVARLADRGDDVHDDPLSSALLHSVDASRPLDLKPLLYQSADPRGWTASIARVVVQLAGEGEPAASKIAKRGAAALADCVTNAAEHADPGSTERPAVYVAGGLLTPGSAYRAFVWDALEAAGWLPDQVRDAPDPATACARLALRSLAAS